MAAAKLCVIEVLAPVSTAEPPTMQWLHGIDLDAMDSAFIHSPVQWFPGISKIAVYDPSGALRAAILIPHDKSEPSLLRYPRAEGVAGFPTSHTHRYFHQSSWSVALDREECKSHKYSNLHFVRFEFDVDDWQNTPHFIRLQVPEMRSQSVMWTFDQEVGRLLFFRRTSDPVKITVIDVV
jgi:hypothetical protein